MCNMKSNDGFETNFLFLQLSAITPNGCVDVLSQREIEEHCFLRNDKMAFLETDNV